MNISMQDLEELTAEKTDLETFMDAVREAQANKEHVSIDLVTMKESTNYTMVIHGVDADSIKYIESTGCISVGGWKDCYNVTVPDKSDIYMSDATPGCDGWQGMIFQYSFWRDDLSVAFLFNYDETIMEEYI